MITGIDMTLIIDTIKETKSTEILELFLREDEIWKYVLSEYSSVTQH